MLPVIQVENLSKAYQLGEFSTGTISHDIRRWYIRMRGKEDPYLKLGEKNDRTSKGESDTVLSLDDINFNINQGEAVGIIGRNGAGKSTLLKILSRITSPTTGSVKVKGRIASLLEVGTGFHPELTGRENIFLNGAILGMRKKEITRKFDEIVDFSGVERYIDTPVKRYSSGMYVRLAFAVAAHLDSEILIVDEVLAVGDAEFQKKCLGKMEDVSKSEGRTVLLVSHNIGSIRALCTKCILLENGQLVANGETNKVIIAYEGITQKDNIFIIGKHGKDEKIIIEKVVLTNQKNASALNFDFGDDIIIEVFLFVKEDIEEPYFQIHLGVEGYGYFTVANSMMDGFRPKMLRKGHTSFRCIFKKAPLLTNKYNVRIAIRDHTGTVGIIDSRVVASFNIVSNLTKLGFNPIVSDSYAHETIPPTIEYRWEFSENETYDFVIDNYIN